MVDLAPFIEMFGEPGTAGTLNDDPEPGVVVGFDGAEFIERSGEGS